MVKILSDVAAIAIDSEEKCMFEVAWSSSLALSRIEDTRDVSFIFLMLMPFRPISIPQDAKGINIRTANDILVVEFSLSSLPVQLVSHGSLSAMALSFSFSDGVLLEVQEV